MKVPNKTPLALTAAAVIVFLGVWFLGYSLAINPSKSMPKGLYLVDHLNQFDEISRGEIVSLCISNASAAAIYKNRNYFGVSTRCPVGLPPVLKPIVGLPGDFVQITAQGTSVNGQLLPNSRLFDTDSQGRTIEHLPIGWSKRLAAGEYFALANLIERSLDSRYYGTVKAGDFRSRARPILIF